MYRVYLPLAIKGAASFTTSAVESAGLNADSASGAEEWVYILRSDTPGLYTLWVEAYESGECSTSGAVPDAGGVPDILANCDEVMLTSTSDQVGDSVSRQ